MRYSHTNLVAKNWRSLVEFYVQVFECRVVPPIRIQSGEWLANGSGVKDATLEGAHLKLPGYGEDGPTLEVYQYSNILEQGNVEPNQRGFGHLAFEVNDVDDVISSVLANGGSLNGQKVRRKVEGVGVITFAYVRNPEGNLIEVQNWVI